MLESTALPQRAHELELHESDGCHLCPGCATRLEEIHAIALRLVPLAELFDRLRETAAAGDGPSLLKVMAALAGR